MIHLSLPFEKSKLLIITIISIYFSMIPLFAVNFPTGDDIAILDFMNKFKQADDPGKEIHLLLEQHNEHRIATTKLIYLIYHKLFGEVNFIHLSFFGNLAILGIFLLFIRLLFIRAPSTQPIPDRPDQNKIIALIIACLLFQYGSAESMVWAMASISNYYVLFFAFLTLMCLKRDRYTYLILAGLFGTLAAYTQGNGFIILIIGNLYLLSRKRYRHFAIWIGITIVLIYFYFSGYQTPGNHSDPSQFYTQIGKIILFMFAFLGSAFGLGGSHHPMLTNFFLVPTVIIGLGVCLITLSFFYKKKYKDGNILLWINLFIILTSFLTAISRINFGLSQALVSRYHINSSVIVASTILLSYPHISSYASDKLKIAKYLFKGLPIFFVLYTILTFPMLYYFSFKIYQPMRNGEINFPVKEKAMEILKHSHLNGIYSIP